jgi:hypothetical protein
MLNLALFGYLLAGADLSEIEFLGEISPFE